MARAIPTSEMPEVARWSLRNLYLGGPLSRLRPRRLSELHSLPLLEPIAIGDELNWFTAVMERHAETISRYIIARQKIESLLLSGKNEEALSELDSTDNQDGYSLFSISMRIGILQLHSGLETQKAYLSTIRESNADVNVKFFSYWWSVRAEDSSTWENFRRDFSAKLRRWSVADGLKSHIGYHILRERPIVGNENFLLSASFLGSAIDIYETFLFIAEATVEENRPILGLIQTTLTKMNKIVQDHKVKKLLFFGNSLTTSIDHEYATTSWRDLSVSDNIPVPTDQPSSLEELQAALTSDPAFEPIGGLQKRLAIAQRDLARPDGGMKGVAELNKLGATLDHLPIGAWLTAYALQPRRISREPSIASLSRRFVSLLYYEPELLQVLGKSKAVELLPLLPPISSSMYTGWRYELNVPPLDPLSVQHDYTEQAQIELDLVRTFKSGDCVALLNLSRLLTFETGQPTQFALEAEIAGLQGSVGLEAAVSKTIDYLLADEGLVHWIPVVNLCRDALRSGNASKRLVDIPIILDFATKLSAQEFASERTFAAEDYLQAEGALLPSDLLRQIPRDKATDRDLYFFGNVCTPSSLRTSSLFQNEHELEDERIVICQWLIQGKTPLADQFEEEARELVRSRHIKQGLQALAGSKLSIDRAGLRRWADRAVREDFDRYMDLLKRGIFSVDDKFRDAVYSTIGSGKVSASGLEVPDNEAASLIARIIGEIIGEFALHSECGLDAYLSLRIRHGTLSGHLRGPVEQERLITRRGSDGRYLENTYWKERLRGTVAPSNIHAVDDRLRALSSKYDGIIEELTQTLIQVRRAEKPKGLIRIDVTPTFVVAMIADTRLGLSFDDFFLVCEESFWAIVEANQPEIDIALDSIFDSVQAEFDACEREIHAIAEEGTAPLRDALLRARNVALMAVDKIKEWLTPPTTPASLTLGIEESIRVSLSVINGFYREFNPQIQFLMQDMPALHGMVRLFSDIFFIIFENVMKYSGNNVDPDVKIEAKERDDHLWFRVTNSVKHVSEQERARIAIAKDRIESGAFRTAVRGEGGTGLPKLAKVIGFGSGGGSIDFSLIDDGSRFMVEFTLRKVDVISPEGNKNG